MYLRDAPLALLSRVEHGPELAHEDASVLPVEEPGKVDLHPPRVHVLLVQLQEIKHISFRSNEMKKLYVCTILNLVSKQIS